MNGASDIQTAMKNKCVRDLNLIDTSAKREEFNASSRVIQHGRRMAGCKAVLVFDEFTTFLVDAFTECIS